MSKGGDYITTYPYSKPFIIHPGETVDIKFTEKLGGSPSVFTRIKSYDEKIMLDYQIGHKWISHPDVIDTNRWFNIEGILIESIRITNTGSNNTKVIVFAYSYNTNITSNMGMGGS